MNAVAVRTTGDILMKSGGTTLKCRIARALGEESMGPSTGDQYLEILA